MSTKRITEIIPGQKIEVQLTNSNVPARFFTEFIGVLKGRWLILNMPDARKYSNLREYIEEGIPVVVRFVLESGSGEICAFRSDINYIVSHPTKMLFIRWPSEVEYRAIRRGRRFDALLPTVVEGTAAEGGEVSLQGHLLDVSETGCRVKHELPEDNEQILWKNGSKINLLIEQKNSRSINLKAIVRQVKLSSHYELGLQFMGNQKDKVNTLFSGSLVDIEELSKLEASGNA